MLLPYAKGSSKVCRDYCNFAYSALACFRHLSNFVKQFF